MKVKVRRPKAKRVLLRDERTGRLLPGTKSLPNAIADAKPPIRTSDFYTRTLASTVKPGDWKLIIARAIRDAKRGNPYARKWLSDHLIGLPVQKINSKVESNNPYLGMTDSELIRIGASIANAGLRQSEKAGAVADSIDG